MKLIDLVAALTLDASEYEKGIDNAQKKAGGIGSALSKVGAVGGTALKATGVAAGVAAAALAGTGAAIYGMASKAAATADELLVMSDKTGIGVEKLQEMQYASELVDVPLETMTSSMGRFTNVLGQAVDGNEEINGIFAEMGISLVDQNGNLRAVNEVWLDAVDALGQYENSANRDIVAQKLFSRSFQDLLPLAKAGRDALEEYGAEARSSGAVVSEAAVKSAGMLDDTMQKIKGTISGVVFSLGSQLAPGVNSVLTVVSGYIGQFGAIIGDTGMSTGEKIAAGAELVGTIANDIAGNLPKMAEAGIGVLKSLITGIVSAIPQLVPAIVQVAISLVQFVAEMLPVIVEGGLQIIVALAQGIAQSLPTLIPAIVEMLMMILQVLIENLPLLIEAGLQIVVGLIQGVMNALPMIIEQLPVLITTIVQVIIQSLPLILEAAVQIIIALITGIVGAIPQLVAAIPQIIMGIVNALISGVPQLLEAGRNLMNGFWSGLKSKFTEIWQGVVDFCGTIVSKIQGVLGIHSDSKVAIELAQNFGSGWITGLAQMQSQVSDAMAGFTGSITATLPSSEGARNQGAALQNASGSKSFSFQIYNPVGESSEDSTKTTMQKLAYLGVA